MSNRRVESFLLRLVVRDSEVPSTDGWRGRVQHISSGCEHQFERMQDLIDFICEQLAHDQSLLIVRDDKPSVE
jgi:hypothetical protein